MVLFSPITKIPLPHENIGNRSSDAFNQQMPSLCSNAPFLSKVISAHVYCTCHFRPAVPNNGTIFSSSLEFFKYLFCALCCSIKTNHGLSDETILSISNPTFGDSLKRFVKTVLVNSKNPPQYSFYPEK